MIEKNEKNFDNVNTKYGYGIRHVQMLCMFLCMMSLFLGRSVLAVAVLAMTDVSRRNDTNIEIFDWDKKTQGIILSSFFWGYIVMQIPVGLLSRKYGGKIIMLFALLCNGLLCLILPTLAHYGGWISVCICRVLMGLSQACLFPASHTMFGRWLPASERTSMSSLVYGGHSLGTIIAMPLSGILAETALGWKMIFYTIGGLMLATAVVWYLFGASSPAEHRMISTEEREYIENDLNSGQTPQKNRPTPWLAILSTVPFWAIMAVHMSTATAFTLFFVDLPTYLDKAMNMSLKNSAILSAFPYLGMWVGSVSAGKMCEWLYNRGTAKLVVLRKIFNSISQFGGAAGFITLAFLHPENKEVAVAAAILTFTLLGFTHAGFVVNHLDLTPQFAGVTLSMTNLMGAVGSIITPVLTGLQLRDDPSDISNWRVVFLIVAGLLVAMNIVYIIFGSTDRQPWDSPAADPNTLEYGYGIRHVQMLCMFLCMTSLFLGRSVLAVAVLAMTDVSKKNDTNIEIFDWDKETQGVILSSFFWGYLIMQVPAGLLSRKYGGKIIMLLALLCNGLLCLVLPTLAHYGGWISVCICRVLMGLSQACLFPASHTMFGRWLPASERTSMSSMVYGGHSLGTIIAMPLSGILAETSLGWKMIFYTIGSVMLATAVVWYCFGASSPAEHRLISAEEREYIENDLKLGNKSQKNRSTPWRAILSTVPIWAIMATHLASLSAFTLFFVDLPTYLDKAMKISLKNSAILSALPYLGMWIGGLFAAFICEWMYNHGIAKLVVLRKVFNSISQFGCAIGYTTLAFLHPDQKVEAVVIAVLSFTVLGFTHAGFIVNHLDLTPQFAGVTLSMTALMGAAGSIVTPVITGLVLKNDPSDISNWRVVFLMIAGLLVCMNIVYIIFGSTHRQPWDCPQDDEVANDEKEPLNVQNKTSVAIPVKH